MREFIENGEQFDHAAQALCCRQSFHARCHGLTCFPHGLQSTRSTLQQRPHRLHLRGLQKITSQELFPKAHHDRMDAIAGGPVVFVLMPHMRHVSAHEHEVPRSQWRDAVAYHAVPVAFDNERKLMLWMEMPLRTVAPPAHHFTME